MSDGFVGERDDRKGIGVLELLDDAGAGGLGCVEASAAELLAESELGVARLHRTGGVDDETEVQGPLGLGACLLGLWGCHLDDEVADGGTLHVERIAIEACGYGGHLSIGHGYSPPNRMWRKWSAICSNRRICSRVNSPRT